jgi:S1/P1 Nuclease
MPHHIRIFILAIVTAVVPRPAWAWGGDGHRTVGMIADTLLQQHPTTRDRVNQILGGVSLSEAAVWADCAKEFRYCHRDPIPEEQAYTRNPNHHDYHFADVPIQQNAYRSATKPYDVVEIIRYSIQVLRGQRPEQSAIWRRPD